MNATTAATRAAGGCAETDNNAADFVLTAPAPRNNTAPATICGSFDAGVDAGRPDAGVDAGRPDAGADAGRPDASCLTLTSWPTVASQAGYVASFETAYAQLSTQDPMTADGGTNQLVVEAYYGAGLTVPATVTFSSADSYGTCDICPQMSRGCDSNGSCTQTLFAQGGSATVTTATQDSTAGQFVGSLTAVRFVEWDFDLDEAIIGGQCVVVTAAINLSWDAGVSTPDAGTGGGAGGGGGATGGGAGGGGGTTDGGSTKDAGMGGTGGGRGGFAGGVGGGSGGGGGSTDAGTDAGSGGGTGGGSSMTGGGTGFLGGGAGGGGGSTPSGCSCGSEGQALMPLLMLMLGALRSRRRTRT